MSSDKFSCLVIKNYKKIIMPTEDEVFKTQVEFLKEAVNILEDRAQKIGRIGRETKYTSKSEAEMKIAIGIFKFRSLKLCKDTLSYIATEAIRDEPKVHFFLLPHVRTLLDVYGRFMHLLENCKDENRQALTCIAYQLLLPKYLDSESEYLKVLALHENFLEEINFNFPKTLSDYGRTWVKKNGLAFSEMKNLLTTSNIKKYSLNVDSIFGTNETYRIYSGFSKFLHGNPYYYYEVSHNEKFWVISTCLSMIAFFIEMIDLHTLKKRSPRDFRIWITGVKKNRLDFVELWKSKKIPKP